MARPARTRAPAPCGLRPRCANGSAGTGLLEMSSRPRPSVLESFNNAIEGVVHVLRTQRNMRIHFAIAVAVLATAAAVGVSKIELVALLLAIAFVLVAEMINTAVESAIDVSTTAFD